MHQNVFFAISTLLLSVAHAFAAAAPAPSVEATHGTPGETTRAPDPMAGLSMDRQMALCARLATLREQGHVLTPVMQRQADACTRMNMASGPQSAPAATLDR